jgi:hypothetical protein
MVPSGAEEGKKIASQTNKGDGEIQIDSFGKPATRTEQ